MCYQNRYGFGWLLAAPCALISPPAPRRHSLVIRPQIGRSSLVAARRPSSPPAGKGYVSLIFPPKRYSRSSRSSSATSASSVITTLDDVMLNDVQRLMIRFVIVASHLLFTRASLIRNWRLFMNTAGRGVIKYLFAYSLLLLSAGAVRRQR